jgi:predicted transposase/invertase (TIGR01784 family)
MFDYPKMHSVFRIREEEHGNLLTDRLEIHFVELGKLNDYNRHIGNELLIAWAEFLNIQDEGEVIHMLEKNLPEEIKRALEVLEEISKDPKMQEAALNLEMGISDYVSRIGDAEDKGREIGERDKAVKIAKMLKTEGLDSNFIAKATDLSVEEIEAL